ncbi:alpha/beta hydrolase [Cytobacillus kochii]|uniref:alpha/beta fold hydrolase n=1 Tax=Cytobacillus kochii TaxID=859143 RepID=UPI002E22B5FC|nr:alpha/beta hydrolase [Cytobacillus kochii]
MYININDNQMYYEEHGNSKGEPIFFIHGAPGLSDCRGDIKAFSDLGNHYRLIFMDMRGSGRSEGKPPFTHEQWIADIEELRKVLIDGPITILGGSYGGFLTLEYVLEYPENVKNVLLRDTSANSDFDHLSVERALESHLPGITEEGIRRLFAGEVHSNKELREMFTAIQPLYTVKFDEEAVNKRLDSIYYRYETHNFAFKYNKPKYNLVPRLGEINVPVLVTVGRHDWITPVESSETIVEYTKTARFVVFENSGHSPQQEENEKYLKLVREFLEFNYICK